MYRADQGLQKEAYKLIKMLVGVDNKFTFTGAKASREWFQMLLYFYFPCGSMAK